MEKEKKISPEEYLKAYWFDPILPEWHSEDVIQALKEYAELARSEEREKNRWIPVEEKLPEKFKVVLIRGSKGNYRVSCLDTSGKIDEYPLHEGEVCTHWKPICPVSPSEKGEGRKEKCDHNFPPISGWNAHQPQRCSNCGEDF